MKRESAFWIFLVVFNIVLILFAVEIGYRYLFSEQNAYSVSTTGNQYHFYQFDPVLGWSNTPGVTGTYKREEFEYTISINQYGMRQHPVGKKRKAGDYRIAVLGDSFVWGIGVADEDRFTEILERQLPGTEVLNFGVSGYGPIQYYLMLDEVIEFDPDLVIVSFCLANDYEDNVFYQRYGYYKPYATVDDKGKLVIKGRGFPNVRPTRLGTEETRKNAYRTILGSKALAAFANALSASDVDDQVQQSDALPDQQGLPGFENALVNAREDDLNPKERALREKAVRINEAILREIQRKLKLHDIDLLLMSAPTKFQYNKSGHYGHEGVYPEAETVLKNSAQALGIPFLGNVKQLTGNDFWQKDGHWNLQGHVKMATSIAKYLSSSGLYAPDPKKAYK
jgi:lysophospholipase L1-like esterase